MTTMRILIRERIDRRMTTLLDVSSIGVATTVKKPQERLLVDETSEIGLRVYPDVIESFEVRAWIGNVIAASTRVDIDRPEFVLNIPMEGDGDSEYFSCSGQLFRNWAGQTDLTIESLERGTWHRVLCLPVDVRAGKMSQEAFEELCSQIADQSAALLMDVYGKTYLGLERTRRATDFGPVAMLRRLRDAVTRMSSCLRAIEREPTFRLQQRSVREPALAGDSVTSLTLEHAVLDSTMVVERSGDVYLRDQVREVPVANYDRFENRVIGGFVQFLDWQISDINRRLAREIHVRRERRRSRSNPKPEGQQTWWESEDLPRIKELAQLERNTALLQRTVSRWKQYCFLPAAPILRTVPRITPLARVHTPYRRAFQVIRDHMQKYRANLDEYNLLVHAKTLPVLYEWWCVLEVIRILHRHLHPPNAAIGDRHTPFRRFAEHEDRFVIEFGNDQRLDFRDGADRIVRLRYEPAYQSARLNPEATYGLLGTTRERTPDIAIEIYGAEEGLLDAPSLILVFDAKYSTSSYEWKIDEVKHKYGKIGLFGTGETLSRQVWALMPGPPSCPSNSSPEWAAFCAVDNHAYWSSQFDMGSTVAGAIQARPRMMAGIPPLESLVIDLLDRAGVRRVTGTC